MLSSSQAPASLWSEQTTNSRRRASPRGVGTRLSSPSGIIIRGAVKTTPTAAPPSSLLYDNVGTCVRLRPTAPAAFLKALVEKAALVEDLTLLGFSEAVMANNGLIRLVQSMLSLHTLSIVSLDLWSATHLQSASALAVGPNLAALCIDSLQVLQLRRLCMGRSPGHMRVFAQALRNHPCLRVLTMDSDSTQLCSMTTATLPGQERQEGGGGGEYLTLDPLLDALATCPELSKLQIYLSGYSRGQIREAGVLATLFRQLEELSFHMVYFPRKRTKLLIDASHETQTLASLHWTTSTTSGTIDFDEKTIDWADILRVNSSLESVSLSLPPKQRASCWLAVAGHPRLESACFSLHEALRQVPAFDKANTFVVPDEIICEKDRLAECSALAKTLSDNPRLVCVYPEYNCIGILADLQALIRFNRGPRSWYLKEAEQWWQLLGDNAEDLDALWLLLRLHPQCVAR